MPAEHMPPPLDAIIEQLKLTNAQIVKKSTEQLTFKQLAKARAGKPVTLNIRHKILNALNACLGEERYKVRDLFKERK
jgi:hypothetical protein